MKTSWTRIGAIGALLALALAAPAATATADKPVPGGYYRYEKVLPRFKGWNSDRRPTNGVTVSVGEQGASLRVGWTLYTGHDCTAMTYGHKSSAPSVLSGGWIDRVAIRPDGTFHGILREQGDKDTRVKVLEARGRFLGKGTWVRVSVRKKLEWYRSASDWERCGGKWLTFRADLDAN